MKSNNEISFEEFSFINEMKKLKKKTFGMGKL